jgi:lipoate-protein ligase A
MTGSPDPMSDLPGAGLRLIEFASLDAYGNMALDGHLLSLGENEVGEGFLRFYTWTRPTLSLGHLEPADVVDSDRARLDGVDIVRRPTGGRVVMHGDDLTYAIVLPVRSGKNLSSVYREISDSIVEGIGRTGVKLDLERGTPGKSDVRQKPCFASVSRYEITYRGRKVVGSAQRIGRSAVLQHGSIPLGRGYLKVADYMSLPEAERKKLMRVLSASTTCLNDIAGRTLLPIELSEALTTAFSDRFGLSPARLSISEFEPEIEPVRRRFGSEFSAGNPSNKRT